MAESVITAFLEPSLGKLTSSIFQEFKSLWGVEKELEKMSSLLSTIQCVLEDAEEKQVSSKPVRDWMRKLKDAAYYAEDVLDKFATEALRSKVEGEIETISKRKRVRNLCFSCFSSNPVLFRHEIAHKIKEINEKLDGIAKQRNDLHLREGDGARRHEIRERHDSTVSLIHKSDVFGRENDKEKLIINLLESDGSVANELSVIPIVGMSGLGKTTLVQLVYMDERVEKHFEVRAWVCVSTDFKLKRLAKAIVESTSKQSSNYEELNSLVEQIQQTVSGKKFLLVLDDVLDDVWNDNSNWWEVLRAPLLYGLKGSKIIVTTQSQRVSSIMGTTPSYPLGMLSDEDCWLLLGRWAFPNESWDVHPNLVEIGLEIAKKCKGLPLSAKTLGGLLRSTREESKWNRILTSETWELPQGGNNNILAPLRLSYYHLPSHLKRCFGYCSLFPKEYVFDKEKLVKLWMAEGFITSEAGQEEMEDVGSDYFDDLLQRSFFQYEETKDNRSIYKMHDLIHDLAQSVQEGECLTREGDKPFRFSEKPRYSSYITCTKNDSTTFFQMLLRCERLRTILVFPMLVLSEFEIEFPNNMFQQLKFLRALDLSGTGIKELPSSIGKLKLLRYLDLSYTYIQRLPESMSSLYNLQTLDLSHCRRLVELPKDARKLINLRHLAFYTYYIRSMPQGIGRLRCLRTLSEFVVGKESGQEIRQLMELINLRGKLTISMLQNAANAKEAVLKNKQHLEDLRLSWCAGDDSDANVAEGVLEKLHPHPNLRMLSIDGYSGKRFPSWIGDPSFSKLVTVELWACRSSETFPPLGQLPVLKKLTIWAMDNVRHVGREFCGDGTSIMISKAFPSLEELHMDSIPNLVEWGGTEEGDLSCLSILSIEICKSLIALPRFLTSLCELHLSECNENILSSLPYFTSLSYLEITSFENLKSIPSGLFKNLKALKKLLIGCCDELVSLVEDEDCKHLHSLESLRIWNCPQLMVLLPDEGLQLLVSLKKLSISGLPQLTSLPSGLKNLISLKVLYIEECERLATLPEEGLPTALQSLHIEDCPLLTQPCLGKGGRDWPNTSHISDIQIDL